MSELQVAVVGAGFMGRAHAHSYTKGGGLAHVAFIVDADEERGRALAGSMPYPVRAVTELGQVLKDSAIDIVDICVPTALHRSLVIEAAQAGKNVICEKPIAPTLEDADAMIQACAESGVLFMVAHVIRFWPEYVTAVEMVERGDIGSLRRITCQRLSSPPTWARDQWIQNTSLSGGAVRDLAIHDFDFIRCLIGTPENIHAQGDLMHFTSLFGKADCLASVEASYSMPVGFPFVMNFRLVGESGVIEFDGTGGAVRLVRKGEVQRIPVCGSRTFTQQDVDEEVDAYFHEIAYFVECVKTGQTPTRVTSQDAREALSMALGIERILGGGK